MKWDDSRMHDWMSPKELAAFFHLSHATIKNYRRRGFMMPGHRQTPSALVVWMAKNIGKRAAR